MTARRMLVALWWTIRLVVLALWWTLRLAGLFFSAACSFAGRVSARALDGVLERRDE